MISASGWGTLKPPLAITALWASLLAAETVQLQRGQVSAWLDEWVWPFSACPAVLPVGSLQWQLIWFDDVPPCPNGATGPSRQAQKAGLRLRMSNMPIDAASQRIHNVFLYFSVNRDICKKYQKASPVSSFRQLRSIPGDGREPLTDFSLYGIVGF